MDGCDSGGHCDFLPIKGESNLGFKHFKLRSRAKDTLANQIILSRFDLAPKAITGICKVPYHYDPEILKYWTPDVTVTDWGYVTEKADIFNFEENKTTYREIQNLIDEIYNKTSLKFWDSHIGNLGLIQRNNTKKLVCIDTGRESFSEHSNAWGYTEPGPQCPDCYEYCCECETVFDL